MESMKSKKTPAFFKPFVAEDREKRLVSSLINSGGFLPLVLVNNSLKVVMLMSLSSNAIYFKHIVLSMNALTNSAKKSLIYVSLSIAVLIFFVLIL